MYKEKLVFYAACFGILLFGIVLITVGSILPSLTLKFGLDEISTGSLVSFLPIGILIGSLVFGPIVDHYGYKTLLIVCSLLVMVGLEGIAFAKEVFVLQASIFLIGLGGGVINGGTNALVADISEEDKGAKLSLLGVFFSIGALGMPVVISLFSQYFDAGQIIFGVGLFVLVPIFFILTISFHAPKHPQGFPFKKSISLLKDINIVMMGFFLFFASGAEGIINNWTTTFLESDLKIDPKNALFGLSCFVVAMMLTRLVLGSLLKRRKPHAILMISLAIAFFGSAVMLNASNFYWAVTGLSLIGIGLGAGFPFILGDVGELFSSISGTAFSIVLTIALIGNTIINYSTGVIAHLYGIRQLFSILMLSVVFMFLLLWFIDKRMNKPSFQ